MKTRVEAGSDIAMIGVWDAGRIDAGRAGQFVIYDLRYLGILPRHLSLVTFRQTTL